VKAGIDGFLFDLDGTFYEGDRLLPGAGDALAWCLERGIPCRFVTNTTSKPRRAVAEKLAGMGVRVPEDWIFTAPAAAPEILISRSLRRCHFLVREALLEDFEGIDHVDETPQAVVIGDMGDQISHARLNVAFRLLLDSNCVFYTLARNRFFRSGSGLELDVGAYTAALEYAAGRKSELIGKPSKEFFLTAAAALGRELGRIAVVGDDLESDVLGAQSAGLRGILVKTGKFRPEHLESGSGRPDEVWDSIASLATRMA
jgi:HAD superfamily hydrolase (TIGR01458 family)